MEIFMSSDGLVCNGNCTEFGELNGNANSYMSRLNKIKEDFDKKNQTKPTTIYHYTNFESLKGILESRCLWLTNYRYLNDSSEINYSCDEVLELIQRIISDLPNLTADVWFWWEQYFRITEKRLKTEFNIYFFILFTSKLFTCVEIICK
jgi:hypothetical protein